ncbi:MAG: hypothetical protein IEMM0006_1444 [bacterium]|nr:MAG: hypothetical protein IEMM0006_1444 [bacterium]
MFKRFLKWTGIVLATLIVLAAILVGTALLRPNRAEVNPALKLETWDAVNDGNHNAFTNMIKWNGALYLVYVSSPYHFGSSDSRLYLMRSKDGHQWEKIARLVAAGKDIRDPKLAVIDGKLFLYALINVAFTVKPYQTVYAVSKDGKTWTPFADVEPSGWLFWSPQQAKDGTYYVAAYWHEHGKSALLKSTHGRKWEIVSIIHDGDRNDETDIEFLPDGRLISTARLEVSDSYFGNPKGSTLISVSNPPFDKWTPTARSTVTRLDGPNLFRYNGRVYAVGRYQPDHGGPFTWQGSLFARKRTSLFLVEEDGLTRLSDLPSAGDTSYAGVGVEGYQVIISYYTSNIRKDYPWILGMMLPTAVRIAKVDLPSLEALAKAKSGPKVE